MQNQFSLSLELTRLIPLGLGVIGKTYEAAMALARDLQSSGSDIVVEEDLAELLGRARITDGITSSFRTEMAKPDPAEPLYGGFSLVRGPGPTVMRALVEPAYFSSVVQCSFLVFVHEATSLAGAITGYFHTIAEESKSVRRAPPSMESIRSTLQACEEQTTAFQWHWQMHLLSIAEILDLNYETDLGHGIAIPTNILQGLMAMLPLVQTLPDDRYVMIETDSGATAIVAWAHLLLGLRITVRTHQNHTFSEVKFPQNSKVPEQILLYVDITEHIWKDQSFGSSAFVEPSIVLFTTSTREKMLELKAELETESIQASVKRPARGIGRRLLEKNMFGEEGPSRTDRERIVDEMRWISCGYALCIACKLCKQHPKTRNELDDMSEADFTETMEDNVENVQPLPVHIPSGQIFEAASMLFDVSGKKFPFTMCENYATLFANTGLHIDQADIPSSLNLIFTEWDDDPEAIDSFWNYRRTDAFITGILILAFAHVFDLGGCWDMPLSETKEALKDSEIWKRLRSWDGKQDISITASTWFEAISLMMVGDRGEKPGFQSTCLLSDRGWSLYTSSFGDFDPSYVEPGYMAIKRGVPWRYGVRKHRVLDGAYYQPAVSFWRKDADFGDSIKLECGVPIAFSKWMVAERNDDFIVSVRMKRVSLDTETSRSGYRELWDALWDMQKTRSCEHATRKGETLKLEPGCISVLGFGGFREKSDKVTICRTAGNAAARWNALLNVKEKAVGGANRVFLRGSDCCLKCAVNQASRQGGNCYLIL